MGIQVLETAKRELGENHPHTLASMANLEAIYQNQESSKEVKKLKVSTVKTNKRSFDEVDPEVLEEAKKSAKK